MSVYRKLKRRSLKNKVYKKVVEVWRSQNLNVVASCCEAVKTHRCLHWTDKKWMMLSEKSNWPNFSAVETKTEDTLLDLLPKTDVRSKSAFSPVTFLKTCLIKCFGFFSSQCHMLMAQKTPGTCNFDTGPTKQPKTNALTRRVQSELDDNRLHHSAT